VHASRPFETVPGFARDSSGAKSPAIAAPRNNRLDAHHIIAWPYA
jgi:hypothetical protein